MRKKHNLELFFCISHNCTMSFSDKESYESHKMEVHFIGKKVISRKGGKIGEKKLLNSSKFRNHGCSQSEYIQEESMGVYINPAIVNSNHEPGTKCKVCHVAFMYPRNMTRHMLKAHGMKAFACLYPGCWAVLENKVSAIQHRRDVHVKKIQNIIKVATDTKEESKTSKPTYSVAEEKYKCDVCNKDFSTADNALAHKEGFHSTKVIKCDLCNAPFKWKQSLQHHMKNSHKSERIICLSRGCYEVFENNEIYRQHKKEMHPRLGPRGKKDKIGGTSELQSRQEESPSKKKARSLGAKKYKCYECKKVFKTTKYLRYHKKKFHSCKVYKCKYNCGEKFKELLEMKEHSATCGLTSE